jgi:allophanate hydrolase subunit 2
MSAALKVVRAGLFDTLQDLGRIGYMALGMPTAGAMDRIGLTLANALAGNPPTRAGSRSASWVPTCWSRPTRARGAGRPAVAVADREPDAPPKPLESDRSHLLKRGQVLRVGMVEGSSTAYLAVAAASPCRLHGQPVDLRPRRHRRLRGPQARRRRRLPLALEQAPPATSASSAAVRLRQRPIRVIWGPQDDYFSARAASTFVESEYRVSKEADRMGIRFEGPTIEHRKGADIISDGIGPAPSRCRAPACRSCCWPTARPSAAIPRSPPWPRSTCRAGPPAARPHGALQPVTVEEAETLRREQEARLARHRRFPGRAARPAASTSRGSTREPDRRSRLRATAASRCFRLCRRPVPSNDMRPGPET